MSKGGLTVHEFSCPFCDRGASASKEPLIAFHQIPWCEAFRRLGATAYLVAVMEAWAKNKELPS